MSDVGGVQSSSVAWSWSVVKTGHVFKTASSGCGSLYLFLAGEGGPYPILILRHFHQFVFVFAIYDACTATTTTTTNSASGDDDFFHAPIMMDNKEKNVQSGCRADAATGLM